MKAAPATGASKVKSFNSATISQLIGRTVRSQIAQIRIIEIIAYSIGGRTIPPDGRSFNCAAMCAPDAGEGNHPGR
jgi:hypothetical protein